MGSDADETIAQPSTGRGDSGRGSQGKLGSHVGRERAGDQIGPYRLISLIGEGGMGEVWLAERRQPYEQRVALKLIKAGMDSKSVLARFEQERQALAVMNHPGIAKVLDGGMTPSGRPYFAMECVKGEPLTDFCDRMKLGIEDRLRLFEQACEAVQHAHLKGIVHRDLKPSNILAFTAEGEGPKLKVIDFGVSKAMSRRMTEHTVFTETGQMIGTPEYMSPEQADPTAGDIDTRSDIYSLGVLLYELLSGATPFDARELRKKAYGEIQRLIREQDPQSPSARLSTLATKDRESASRIEAARMLRMADLVKRLRGELEWIPLKAMRKEPQHRYQTAIALAEDVRNYLEGRPLVAAPESTAYRVRKYVRRNRALVAGASAVMAALVFGLGAATWQWLAAERARDAAVLAQEQEAQQREEAEQQRARADERAIAAERAEKAETERADQLKQVSDFQAEMLGQIDTTMVGVELMRDIRERFAEALAKADVPEAERASQAETLAELLTRVNATDAAAEVIDRTILRPAVESIDERFKNDPKTDAQLRQTLAELYRTIGLYEASFPLQEAALATRHRVMGEDHPDTISSINKMSCLLVDQGKFSEAEEYFRSALEKSRRVLGEDHPETISATDSLGGLLVFQGKLSEAEPYSREALDRRRRVLGEDHHDTINSINGMGRLLISQGKPAEAEPYFRDALEKSRRVLGEDHPDTIAAILNMGVMLRNLGRPSEAESSSRDALERCRRVMGEEHPHTLSCSVQLAFLLQSQGRLSEAEPYYRDALDTSRRVQGDDHPTTVHLINNFAVLLRQQGKHSEAEPYLREALETGRRVLGDDHPETIIWLMNLGSLLQHQGEDQEALDLLAPNELRTRKTFTDIDARRVAIFLMALGRARVGVGYDSDRFRLADANLLESHAIFLKVHGESHKETHACAQGLVDLYTAWNVAQPGKGYDAKAAEWKAKLEAAKASAPVAPSS